MADRYGNWTGIPRASPRLVLSARESFSARAAADPDLRFLARGEGRSYGDVCLIDGGALIDARGLDRFISFDERSGLLCAEAGVTLAEILDVTMPRGWFLPVAPGTRFVTLGGAIANDVHGKNHHRAGTFGMHIARFQLSRSDGSRIVCSPVENVHLFRATIGGLGMTGLIEWVEVRLRSVVNPWLSVSNRRFANLGEFFELDAELVERHEYTVAWVDCLARGNALGRGIYAACDHAPPDTAGPGPSRFSLSVPARLPFSPVNRFTMRAFNGLYFHRPMRTSAVRHYKPWFFPLDQIRNWNRLYGRHGFVQFQCVVPRVVARDAIGDMLRQVAASGEGSFLAVLKNFGDLQSPGFLSFPMHGTTLALDFPFRGARTRKVLDTLYAINREAGGRIYPAKDALSPADNLRAGYPAFSEFEKHIDPRFCSDMWRRLTRASERTRQ